MKDIRIDDSGDFRCWKCGGRNFTEKRTLRSKAAVGVGALLTKKKLKCQSCGEYNDVGNAKPYAGPKSKRAAKKAGVVDESAPQPAAAADGDPEAVIPGPQSTPADELQKYADLLDRELISREEFDARKAELFPPIEPAD